ncbi:MAG: hypothetical protein HOY78_17145 [Saccharothrix sp.]|nr:hypothetical protein [Saccharothrix sp.]
MLVTLSATALALSGLALPTAQATNQAAGKVLGWGDNAYYQAGQDNTGLDYNEATQICTGGNCGSSQPFTKPKAVAAGEVHSLALMADGAVWAWGSNGQGRLGIGSNVDTNQKPTRVCDPTSSGCANLVGAKAIAAGYSHSLAILKDGSVAAWGNNDYGKLGTNDTTHLSKPKVVCSAAKGAMCAGGAKAIDAGFAHSLVLLNNGQVLAWGSNIEEQLGIGKLNDIYKTPQRVLINGTATAIAAGRLHSLAVVDGKVVVWGHNDAGQLGKGNTGNEHPSPEAINLNAKAVAAGEGFSMALTDDGKVYTWGLDAYGALGNGKPEQSTSTPGMVCSSTTCGGSTLEKVKTIAAGHYHALAVGQDGLVYSWGRNETAQLADGTTEHRYQPGVARIGDNNTDADADSLMGISGVAGGLYHSLAVRGTGTNYAIHPASNTKLAVEMNSQGVRLAQDTDRAAQQWRLEEQGGGKYRIVNADTEKCLATGRQQYGITALVAQTCGTDADQLWELDPTKPGEIRNSGCLDASGGVQEGAEVIAYECNNGDNQQWKLTLAGA